MTGRAADQGGDDVRILGAVLIGLYSNIANI